MGLSLMVRVMNAQLIEWNGSNLAVEAAYGLVLDG